MTQKTTKQGAHGWPLIPSVRFPGESALSCLACGGRNITLTCTYGPGGRLGDPGAHDIIHCDDCGHQNMKPSKPLQEIR